MLPKYLCSVEFVSVLSVPVRRRRRGCRAQSFANLRKTEGDNHQPAIINAPDITPRRT